MIIKYMFRIGGNVFVYDFGKDLGQFCANRGGSEAYCWPSQAWTASKTGLVMPVSDYPEV